MNTNRFKNILVEKLLLLLLIIGAFLFLLPIIWWIIFAVRDTASIAVGETLKEVWIPGEFQFLKHVKDKPGDPSLIEGLFFYPKYHFSSARTLFQLANFVKARLSEITAPIHLFHSVKDTMVHDKNADDIASGVSSKIVKLIKVEKSGHVLTRDLDREFIMEKSLEFVMEISN